MRSTTLLIHLSRSLLVAFCSIQANAYSQSKEKGPYQIKNIFIEPLPNLVEGRTLDRYMEAELERRGFGVVNEASKADAILSLVNSQGEIVLHSNEDIPHKSIIGFA
jgi:hypothetical protein